MLSLNFTTAQLREWGRGTDKADVKASCCSVNAVGASGTVATVVSCAVIFGYQSYTVNILNTSLP